MFKENKTIERYTDYTKLEINVKNNTQPENDNPLFSDIIRFYKVVKSRKAFNSLGQTINRAV